ncbi:UNVERIFIED_CONTAM: hypothetical protein PYX00_010025 [Menopon gallinae]|uniref:Uncharacterized protein n=1 Tax=Menopon gallinae TaxID=328185 RepID=A0AAW2HDU4_9NEOP
MTSPIGYNNPAYTHQFDSSLYEYQYVPEIDPEFDGHPEGQQEQMHLVHPNFQDEFSGTSEEFEASDESNQSIIVEECNNRRVTMICEKRSKTEKFYEDQNCKGAYHHNISLESEEDYVHSKKENKPNEGVSQRHQRRLDPPVEANGNVVNGFCNEMSRNHLVAQPNVKYYTSQRPQRQHRYEEIDSYEEVTRPQQVSRHRYAEITVDENGYPSIGNEIEIEQNESGYRIVNTDTQREYIKKPRAASPFSQTVSPTFSPSKTYQRTISPHPPGMEINLPRTVTAKQTAIPSRNNIEMAELSPPQNGNRGRHGQFLQSPKRHPPIGASSPADLQERIKSGHKRQQSMSSFREPGSVRTPGKSATKPSVTQLFQAKTNSSRRNISHSFTDPPDLSSKPSSPYRPTTAEISRAKTAIITPILQRKNRVGDEDSGNFRKTSQMFQSTGNLYKEELQVQKTTENKARIKRNRSVPNFAQSLANEGKFRYAKTGDYQPQSVQKSVRKLDYSYSPAKSADRFSPINRSRISLIDQTKMSWSNSGSDFQPPTSGCLLIGAIIQIATSIASCAICFYLFSKLGRRYYLDFGILAGFVNFVLGVLGFRSQCWRWLPNRNYVSGYILLTAFSIITCAGFVYLITARPMSGDPILDLMGGGICGVSVLTIVLAVTGLTMSGCCKTPPPDNRVNNI